MAVKTTKENVTNGFERDVLNAMVIINGKPLKIPDNNLKLNFLPKTVEEKKYWRDASMEAKKRLSLNQ